MAYQEPKESSEADDECRLLPPSDLSALPSNDRYRRPITGCLVFLLLLLFLTNAATVIYFTKMKIVAPIHTPASLESLEEHWTTFQTMTEYSSPDPAVVDAAWQKYVINGFITLPLSWAEERHWPAARPMPGNPSEGIYVVDGFHQLHCLMSIRDTVSALVEGGPVQNRTHTIRHLNHCYDALRQAIICRADETPLYVPKDTFWAGDGQQRLCRDWAALEDWVIRHTACVDPTVFPSIAEQATILFDILDIHDSKDQGLGKLLRLAYTLYRQGLVPAIKPVRISHLTELDIAVNRFSDSFVQDKVLILYEKSDKKLKVKPSYPVVKLRPDASYLLVGALGGLGWSLGSWMMDRGARHFCFMARSGTDSKQAMILVDHMRRAGASVQVIRGDVTVRADVDDALMRIPPQYPVHGVVHAAMVLRDGLFHSTSYKDWTKSTGPKVTGAKNLHEALRDTELDFFIMTSSASGILGTPGQVNYAAGNAYLDSLAQHRVANGKVGVSLVLPMVLGVGYVAEHPEVEEALKRKGVYGIDKEHLLRSFEATMSAQARTAGIHQVIIGIDPAKLQKSIKASETTDGFWFEDKRFHSLLHSIKSSSSDASGGGSDASMLVSIRTSKSPANAVELVTKHFTNKLSRLLLLDMAKFEDPTAPISAYGLDSMIGAELRNWIFREYALDIPFQQLLGPTLTTGKFAIQVCASRGVVVEEAAE